MEDCPLVSVIINCYNSEKYLKETIDSVLAQTYSHYEVIFWDNCSTDSTADIIHSYNDVRFRYFKASNNSKLGLARNYAIDKVQGKYFGFLDSDDIWLPDFLETCVTKMEEGGKSYSAVYTNYYDWNDNQCYIHIKDACGGEKHLKEIISNYKVGMSANLISSKIVQQNRILFDENLQLIEDFDFFCRLAATAPLCYIPEGLVKYRVHSDSMSFKNIEGWAEEYDCIYKLYKRRFVDRELIKEEDLTDIKRHYQYYQLENLMKQGRKWSIFMFLLRSPFLSFKAWTRLLYVIGGNKLYDSVKSIKIHG